MSRTDIWTARVLLIVKIGTKVLVKRMRCPVLTQRKRTDTAGAYATTGTDVAYVAPRCAMLDTDRTYALCCSMLYTFPVRCPVPTSRLPLLGQDERAHNRCY
eukprot:3809700-Rhodomonas_salina.1